MSNLVSPISKLEKSQENKLFVCVGLDSDNSQLPSSLVGNSFEFNRQIIDATAEYSIAFKPNSAFYEEEGASGIENLEKTFAYLREKYPDKLTILDAKRADIGNTNKGYAKMAFDSLSADALTVAPYMGGSILEDGEVRLASLEPFLDRRDKLVFVLCRTSNEDAGEFQDLPISIGKLSQEYKSKFGDLKNLSDIVGSDIVPLYLIVAYKIAHDWNKNGNLGLVVGATYPEELAVIRKVAPDMPILAPGIGFQGGDTKRAIQSGLNSKKGGLIVNSSRGIIFAGKGKDNFDVDFAKYAAEAAKSLHEEIKQYIE